MVAPISIQNMANMLYGNPFAYVDGMGAPYNAYDSMANSYGYLNPNMYYNSAYDYNSAALANKQAEEVQASINKRDFQTLADYYAKNMEPSESLTGAAVGGAAFGVLMHPRYIAHPINSVKGLKDVSAMFKGVRTNGTNLNKLWNANNEVMREAYFQMHKAASRQYSKIGLFRKRYSQAEYAQLKEIMEKALKSGNIDEVAKASETLKHAYINNGGIPKLWNKIRGKELPTVAGRIKESEVIAKNTSNLILNSGKKTYLETLKKGGGVKGGLFFMAIELLLGWNNIKTAYAKDSETGNKQLCQTLVKGAGSAVGWAAGEALGIWGSAALGAKIGTLFGPGIGTAIGGLAGIICGSIGCWLAGKATKALVGDDVANQITADNMLKTPEGQVQLLQLTAQTAQNDKELDPKVAKAFQNLVTQYA